MTQRALDKQGRRRGYARERGKCLRRSQLSGVTLRAMFTCHWRRLSLRLDPPVQMTMRSAPADVEIPGGVLAYDALLP